MQQKKNNYHDDCPINVTQKTILLGVITIVITVTLLLPTSARATVGVPQTAISATPSATTTASVIWGYSSRTMLSFGNLVSDIWNYFSRSVNGMKSIVATGPSASPVSSPQASAEQVHSTGSPQADSAGSGQATAKETPLPPEHLVKKPDIQNPLDAEPIDLAGKIHSSLDMVNALNTHEQYINSKIGLMSLKWDLLSREETTKELAEIDKVLGMENDESSQESVFGRIAWLKSNWQWPILDDVYSETQALKTAVKKVQLPANAEESTESAEGQEIEPVVANSTALDRLIGDKTRRNEKETVFGKLNSTKELADALNTSDKEIDMLLAQKSVKKALNMRSQVDTITHTVLALNRIPKAKAIVEASKNRKNVSDENSVNNGLLSLKGLIHANIILLAKGSKAALSNTWLETGSVVFKSLITNPSSLSQEVPLKYYLPAELTKEDVIEVNEGLAVASDAEKNQLYVEGKFTLDPGESKTVEVRVEDKWKLSKELIESLRRQAAELFRPLEKTAFFARGTMLKSDINVSLDKALVLAQGAATPDQKIRSFRQTDIELKSAQNKLDKLKDLVTRTSSSGMYFGFGGSQTLAAGGLIFILGIGFVFLMLYMRVLTGHLLPMPLLPLQRRIGINNIPFPVIAFLAFGLLIAVISSITVASITKRGSVAGVVSPVASFDNTLVAGAPEVPETTVAETTDWTKMQVLTTVVPQGMPTVNLREHPSTKDAIVYKLADKEPVVKLEDNGQWIHVALVNPADEIIEGWVYQDYVKEHIAATDGPPSESDTTPRY